MKRIFVLFLTLTILGCSNFGQQNHRQINCGIFKQSNKKEMANKMQIDLQDWFENDTVTIYINECLVLKNEVLRSNVSTGYTGVNLTIVNNTRSAIIKRAPIIYIADCPHWPDIFYGYPPDTTILDLSCLITWTSTVRVTAILNRHKENFDIDLNKGAYIGFSRRECGQRLWLSQSERPFIYD